MDAEVAFWLGEIEKYEKDFCSWEERSSKVYDRYKNDKKTKQNRFNILYSNIQTLAPALYSQLPKPNFERRFNGDDSVGRVTSLILERAVSYYIDNDEFDDCMQQTVLDRLLCGRGTAWVRYQPTFESGQLSEDLQTVKYEDVRIDYVHWCDFGHTFARTWQEMRAVWRKVKLTKKQLTERFGEEVALNVPMDGQGELESEDKPKGNMACVYEIWDSQTKTVFWVSKGYESVLDKRQDPLGLKDFFPCPRPLYSLVANNNLIPTPDYFQYQDQAAELDMVTMRIDMLVKALRVSGIYDSSAEALKSLLSESSEMKMIPVDNWAMYKEAGGLKSAVSFFPLAEIITALQQMYVARDQIKQTIYEITGISDIIRGASVASETATAQNIKSQYATMRLGKGQKDVQRFCRDIIRVMTEIIATQFSLETIKKISGVTLLSEQEKAQYAQLAQTGQPLDPRIESLMKEPTWEQVYQLMQDDMMRCFRIDIEIDSTIKADQEAEKSAKAEFLTSVSQFITMATQVQNPQMQPLMLELMRFGVQGFRIGKTMEAEFNNVIDKARQAALQPPPPQADPVAMEAEQKKAELEMKMQEGQASLQADMQKEQMKIESNERIEAAKLQAQVEMKQMELAVNKEVDMERENHVTSREALKVKSTMTPDAIAMADGQIETSINSLMQGMGQLAQSIDMNQQEMSNALMTISQSNAIIAQSISKPKTVEIKDANGNVVRSGVIV